MVNKAKIDDVVQINENHKWCGAFVYVSEVFSYGIKGFIYIPEKGKAHIRLAESEYEFIGEAVLIDA